MHLAENCPSLRRHAVPTEGDNLALYIFMLWGKHDTHSPDTQLSFLEPLRGLLEPKGNRDRQEALTQGEEWEWIHEGNWPGWLWEHLRVSSPWLDRMRESTRSTPDSFISIYTNMQNDVTGFYKWNYCLGLFTISFSWDSLGVKETLPPVFTTRQQSTTLYSLD